MEYVDVVVVGVAVDVVVVVVEVDVAALNVPGTICCNTNRKLTITSRPLLQMLLVNFKMGFCFDRLSIFCPRTKHKIYKVVSHLL